MNNYIKMKNLFLRIFWTVCVFANINLAYSQTEYKKPKLENKSSWTVILLPDIQNYSKWGVNQPILDLMIAWIEANIDTLNVKMVMCVGDLVQHDNIIITGVDGDQTSRSQWEAVSKSFSKLDGKVPYITATGNHDYTIDSKGNRKSQFSNYFNIERNFLNKKVLAQTGTNEAGELSLDNSAYEVKSLNGQDYLFLTLEFAPRDTMVNWANKITALEQYKNHRIILLTHAYLNQKDKRTDKAPTWLEFLPYTVNNEIKKSASITLPNANSGEQIWQKLVEPSANIELVLSGHISGEGYRKDNNLKGNVVHQMLFDTQSIGGGHRTGNGGDGWLRILEFFPDNKTVKIKTFSPLFGISPTTQQFAWKTDERNEYTIKFD